MKLLILFLLLISVPDIVCAQGYYPLDIDNIWQYCDCYDTNYYEFTTRALGDTVMPNNFAYTILASDRLLRTQYLRQVDTKVYNYSIYRLPDTTWQREELIYDFSKTTFDTVTIYYYPPYDTVVVIVVYDRIRNVFGKMRRQWGFLEQSTRTSMYILREITDSIGLTFLTFEPGIIIYDITGKKVRKLFDGETDYDLPQLVWDGKNDLGMDVGSGTYIYQLRTSSNLDVKRMVLIR